MAKAFIDDTNLTAIADAIRLKNGSTDTYMPSEMSDAINELQVLDTSDATATAEDMREGATAYVNGEKITGSLPFWTDIYWATPTASWDEANNRLKLAGTFGARRILEKSSPASMYCSGEKLGDAAAEDVVAGRTFTSAAGLKVTGTHVCIKNISLPSEAYWQSVAYGKGKFVVVSNSDIAAYSYDGITWTEITLPTSANWRSIAYGKQDGYFVAVAYGSNIAAYSDDGITWTQIALPLSANWQSVAYGKNRFVAVAYGNSNGTVTLNGNIAAYSADGITWEQIPLPSSAYWKSVACSKSRFVAIAYGTASGSIYFPTTSSTKIAAYSDDGYTWTSTTLPTSAKWQSVAYDSNNDRFVATSTTDVAAYSDDGITWTSITLPSSINWNSITYGKGKFVAVSSGSDSCAYSSDGITWEQTTLPSSASWSSVTYGGGRFVAVASNSDIVVYSYDGIIWYNLPPEVDETKTAIVTLRMTDIEELSGYMVSSDNGEFVNLGEVTDGVDLEVPVHSAIAFDVVGLAGGDGLTSQVTCTVSGDLSSQDIYNLSSDDSSINARLITLIAVKEEGTIELSSSSS